MKVAISVIISVVFILGAALPALAGPSPWNGFMRDNGLVVDHQPHPYGGLGSDTVFRDYWGNPVWQRVADDILLQEEAIIRRIAWWGFYGSSFDDWPEPPPDTETMRIRFYHARPGDGLPDDNNIVFEESFLNPSRAPTGEIVWVGPDPPEYLYEVDLATSVSLDADTPYWLEIVQVGDLESHFRWEFGSAERNGQAVINEVHGWECTWPDVISDTAFQLWAVPEPTTIGLAALGVAILHTRMTRRRKRRCRG